MLPVNCYLLFALFCLLFVFAAGPFSAQATITRFGVVDMNRVMALFTGHAAVKAFTEKREAAHAEIERQNRDLQALAARLEEARAARNNAAARSLEQELTAKTQAAKDYVTAITAELEKEREKLQPKANMAQVTEAIRIVAEGEGMSMVLAREGARVLWCSPSVDITNKVIQRLSGRSTR